jgi:GDPmannose 4,6-dehydratase
MTKAIITGISGQDGYYLADFLLNKGYEVIGISRRPTHKVSQNNNNDLYFKYYPRYQEINGDICDSSFMMQLISSHKPDEFYNLAAQTHVGYSFSNPDITFDTNAMAVLNILEAIRLTSKHTRFYQASTSEMYGTIHSESADETTPLNPYSPYGVAKTAAHHMVSVYRESYDIWACSGILFNHESERRGKDFVTRKVTSWVAGYKKFLHNADHKLHLGNISSVRDWGYAPDYVRGMWQMLQHSYPDDYVLATGETRSIRDLLDTAFGYIGIDNWSNLVVHNTPADIRPNDVTRLCGNPAKAMTVLGWKPEVSFNEMIGRMIDHDIEVSSRH